MHDVPSSDTKHGVGDTTPRPVQGRPIVEVYRDVEWICREWKETGEISEELVIISVMNMKRASKWVVTKWTGIIILAAERLKQ